MKIQVIAVKTCTVTKSREDLILSLKIRLLYSMNFLPLTLNYRLSSGFSDLLVSFSLPLLFFFVRSGTGLLKFACLREKAKCSLFL